MAKPTRLRLAGSIADVLLPGHEADFRDFVGKLRESGIFPEEDPHLERLSSWEIAPGRDARAGEWLEPKKKDAAVWLLQAALRRLSEIENAPELAPGAVDGDYGAKTEAAVRAFQARRGIEVDGIAGPETQGEIDRALETAAISAIRLRGAHVPEVGIVLSHPRKLVPGEDEEAERLANDLLRMGCHPVFIPPCADLVVADDAEARSKAIRAMAAALDGLLGPGGDDVDPAIYDEPMEGAEGTNYRRDRFEADFALEALSSHLFAFGICRSHQLWNAASGGSLVQDVQAEGFSGASQRQGDYGIPGDQPFVVRGDDGAVLFENRVELAPGSEIAEATDEAPSLLTNSYHHQAVDEPGKGFVVVGTVYDPRTGRRTIEATERWNAITTQFHPEVMQNDPAQKELFETLGRRARIFRLVKVYPSSPEELTRKMGEFPADLFDDSDFDWVLDELARNLHLGRR